MRTVRFWIWHNDGPVRLTVRPGQELSYSSAWSHEEGWSAEGARYWLEDDGLHSETFSDGVDCDGRLEQYAEWLCPLDQLAANDFYEPQEHNGQRIGHPHWERVSAHQRDHYAEAAGY